MKPAQSLKLPIRIVFYREDDSVIAHCLEFDLMGDGRNTDEAMRSLCDAIFMQVQEVLESGNTDNLFGPAPKEFFIMFAAGKSSDRVGKAVGKLEIKYENLEFTEVSGREYFGNGNDHTEEHLALA